MSITYANQNVAGNSMYERHIRRTGQIKGPNWGQIVSKEMS